MKVIDEVFQPLKKGYVRVKMHGAPINPSDRYFTHGMYGILKRQKIDKSGAGLEGSGVVVELGEGVPEIFQGAKVAVGENCHDPDYSGTWAEYSDVNHKGVIPFPPNVDLDQIACTNANPLTACGFIDIARQQSSHTIIHDAAASALGKILNRLAPRYNLNIINIVRR